MRQRAITALVDGESLRSVLSWLSPVVSLEALRKLRSQVISEIDAAKILHKAKQLQAMEAGLHEPKDETGELAKLAVAGSRHVARIERMLEPLERQIHKADAEDDRQGLSSVAKAALSAIRTQAELDGSLMSTSVNQSVTQNILILPFGQPQADQPTPAIDTTAEPIDA